MDDNIKVNEEASQPQLSIGAQRLVDIKEVQEAMNRLRISPRKVLELLGHLRIEKPRIKPLEDKGPKAGGNADVEAAILVPPARSSTSSPPGDEEYVAVKKLRFDTDTDDDRVLAPFSHEVNLLNELSHPNVVKVVGFVEDVEQGIAWMVFLWEKNGNLREFVRSANWELPERVSLINDVIEGLSYLHGRNPPICHGDLKSLNILVNSGNRAVITDFGSARTLDSATEVAVRGLDAATTPTFQHRTPTGAPTIESLKAEISASGDSITMTGPAWTIRWAAPELLEGEFSSLASDIWALGWICWEAVTGNFPFEEDNDISIVLRITRGDLPAVSDHAQLKQVQELCSLIGECWRLDANARPTAIRCQQVTSFMDRSIPSNNEGSVLATTRSSGLLFALGRIQMKNDRLHEAQIYFQQSLDVAKSVGDKRGRARALKAQGDLYHLRNEHSNAEKSYIQARDVFSQIGSRLGIAYSVKSLAHVYYKRGEHSEAETSYIQARDIFSQMGDQLGFAQSVKGLGQVHYMRKEYSKAEDSYIQARDMYLQIGYQLGFARSLEDLGYVSYIRNEYSKAEDWFVQARDIYSRIGSQLDFANSVQALGRLYSAQGQDVKAEDPYLQAQAVYRRTGRVRPLANNLWLLACLRRRQARYGDVERLVCEASTLYGKLGLKGHVADCDAFLKEVRQLKTMSRGRISPR